jgi:hypothetical protein
VKCVHCHHDSKLKDRRSGVCPKCGHRFAFEPTKGDLVTDGVFAAAVQRVSAGGTVRFTAEHLYYDVRRRHARRSLGRSIAGFIGIGAFTSFVLGNAFGFLGVLAGPLLFAVLLWLRLTGGQPLIRRMDRAKFDALLTRYKSVHPVTGLIERAEARVQRPERPINVEEMLAYSFDRAVICDRPATVDLLLANQFHFENNCAVLSIDGYPEHAFDTVRSMLRNNPRLVVIAIHDATVAGCQVAHRLRTDPAWFKEGVPVIDIGLRPRHRFAFRGQEDRHPRRAVAPGRGISASEARWLERNSLSLAVVVPEQVIKRLFRAITEAERRADASDSGSSSGGGGGDSGSSSSFEVEADVSDGGVDSFG